VLVSPTLFRLMNKGVRVKFPDGLIGKQVIEVKGQGTRRYHEQGPGEGLPGKADFPMSVASLRAILEAVNRGAGGAVFHPMAGLAKRIDGPWEGVATLWPSYRWTLEIAGVAPLFLRNMGAEQLAMARDAQDLDWLEGI